MTIEQKTILTPSLIEFAQACWEAGRDGEEFDPEKMPAQFGWQYEVGFLKETSDTPAVKVDGRRKRGFGV